MRLLERIARGMGRAWRWLFGHHHCWHYVTTHDLAGLRDDWSAEVTMRHCWDCGQIEVVDIKTWRKS